MGKDDDEDEDDANDPDDKMCYMSLVSTGDYTF